MEKWKENCKITNLLPKELLVKQQQQLLEFPRQKLHLPLATEKTTISANWTTMQHQKTCKRRMLSNKKKEVTWISLKSIWTSKCGVASSGLSCDWDLVLVSWMPVTLFSMVSPSPRCMNFTSSFGTLKLTFQRTNMSC